MKELLDFLKKTPLVTGILALVIAIGGIHLVSTEGMFATGLFRFILVFAMGAFLYLISKEKTFEKSNQKTSGYVIMHLLGFIIFSFVVALLLWGLYIYQQKTAVSNWPLEVISTVFFALGVGFFEEMLFRAVLNDAIIYQFRKCKGVFVIAALASSLIFGYVHVMFEDFTNTAILPSIILKTISTGMMGLALTFLYWKTRNILALAIVHAVYDLFPVLPVTVFGSSEQLGNYATSDVKGFIWYIVQIVISAFFLIHIGVKVVKKTDFKEIRENW